MSEVIQGIVQGVTEFLPISSSGHIVFLERLGGFSSSNLAQLQIGLHLGTLLSILLHYFKDIKELILSFKDNKRYISFIFVGTLPLVLTYFLFYDYIKNIHNNPDLAFQVASYCILVTGFILLLTKFASANKELTFRIVLIIGFMQCLALLPGISRSGITICSALLLGVGSKSAAKFSFLLAIPAILGAGILDIKDIIVGDGPSYFPYLGFVVSFLVGYISLKLLIFFTYDGKLWLFSIYCFIVGLIAIFLF